MTGRHVHTCRCGLFIIFMGSNLSAYRGLWVTGCVVLLKDYRCHVGSHYTDCGSTSVTSCKREHMGKHSNLIKIIYFHLTLHLQIKGLN